MKQALLGLSVALLLSGCGSSGTKTVTPAPAQGTQTATDDTADSAADSTTVSQDYYFDMQTGKAVAQGLISTQDIKTNLGNRLHVTLAVTQGKSGATKGQRHASATFIWGNENVKLGGTYKVKLLSEQSGAVVKTTSGKLDLAVKYPDFQVKSTRSTQYLDTTDSLCALLDFNLTADGQNWNSLNIPPIKLCEGDEFKTAESGIPKAIDKLYYKYNSLGIAKLNFIRLTNNKTSKAPTNAEILQYLNLPSYLNVSPEYEALFFEGMKNTAKNNTEIRRISKLRLIMARLYGSNVKGYKIKLSSEKERIVLIGWNQYGISGIDTMRFYTPDGKPNAGYEAAGTYPSLWRDSGQILGSVQVGQHDVGATVAGRYSVREATTCEANPGAALDKQMTLDPTFTPTPYNQLTSSQLLFGGIEDNGQDVVVDYAVDISLGSAKKTYKGVVCDILTTTPEEPVPPPSVKEVEIYPSFWHNSYNGDGKATNANVGLYMFDGTIPEWNYTGTMTATGTYKLEDSPDCGAAEQKDLSSGDLNLIGQDAREFYLFYLAVPDSVLGSVGPHTRLNYTATINGLDGARTMTGGRCVNWQE